MGVRVKPSSELGVVSWGRTFGFLRKVSTQGTGREIVSNSQPIHKENVCTCIFLSKSPGKVN